MADMLLLFCSRFTLHYTVLCHRQAAAPRALCPLELPATSAGLSIRDHHYEIRAKDSQFICR
jgi:hypothetical protein